MNAIWSIAFLWAGLSGQCEAQGREPWLRGSHYVLLRPTAGHSVGVRVGCVTPGARPEADPGPVTYVALDESNNVIASGGVRPGRCARLELSSKSAGLVLLKIVSGGRKGRNLATVKPLDVPWAIYLSPVKPFHVRKQGTALWFRVPTWTRRFSVWVRCGSPGEGARIRVVDPNGRAAAQRDGEFDAATRVRVAVPAGAHGKQWRVEVLEPARGILDDVELWFSSNIPPFVCPERDRLFVPGAAVYQAAPMDP